MKMCQRVSVIQYKCCIETIFQDFHAKRAVFTVVVQLIGQVVLLLQSSVRNNYSLNTRKLKVYFDVF